MANTTTNTITVNSEYDDFSIRKDSILTPKPRASRMDGVTDSGKDSAVDRPNARKIRALINEHGISQAELSRNTGIHATTISNIYNLKQEPEARTAREIEVAVNAVLERRKLAEVERVYRVDDEAPMRQSRRPWVRTSEDASRKDPGEIGHGIPTHTYTEAGSAKDYQRGVLSDRFLPSALVPHPEWGLGAFVVRGESMAPYIKPGDILIIGEELKNVRTDDIILVGFKTGEHTVKRLRIIDDDTWELLPTNPEHRPQTVKRSQVAWYVPVLARIEPIYLRREVKWGEEKWPHTAKPS